MRNKGVIILSSLCIVVLSCSQEKEKAVSLNLGSELPQKIDTINPTVEKHPIMMEYSADLWMVTIDSQYFDNPDLDLDFEHFHKIIPFSSDQFGKPMDTSVVYQIELTGDGVDEEVNASVRAKNDSVTISYTVISNKDTLFQTGSSDYRCPLPPALDSDYVYFRFFDAIEATKYLTQNVRKPKDLAKENWEYYEFIWRSTMRSLDSLKIEAEVDRLNAYFDKFEGNLLTPLIDGSIGSPFYYWDEKTNSFRIFVAS